MGEKGLVQGLWVVRIPINVLRVTERLPFFIYVIWKPEFNFIYLLLLNLLTKTKNMKKAILSLALATTLVSCGGAVTEGTQVDSIAVDSVETQVDSAAVSAVDSTVAKIPAEQTK